MEKTTLPNGFPLQQQNNSTHQSRKKREKKTTWPIWISKFLMTFLLLNSRKLSNLSLTWMPGAVLSVGRNNTFSIYLPFPPSLYPLIISAKFSSFPLRIVGVQLIVPYCKTNQNVWCGIKYIRKVSKTIFIMYNFNGYFYVLGINNTSN